MFTKLKNISDVCPICEDEKDLTYGERDEEMNVRNEKIKVKSKVYYCTHGKHYFTTPKDEEEKFQRGYREYRKRKGLLQPEEIKHIRIQYGLSQRDLARLLGFGEITIQRYESGAIQDNTHNNLLSFIKEPTLFRILFERNKNNLSSAVIGKIEANLKKIEDEEQQLAMEFALIQDKAKIYEFPSKYDISIRSSYKKIADDSCCNDIERELALAA